MNCQPKCFYILSMNICLDSAVLDSFILFFVMKGSAYIFSNFKVRLKFDVIFGIWLSCTRHGSQNNECNNGAQNVLMKMDIFAMPLTQIIGSTPDSTKNQTSKPLLLDYSGNTICVFSQTENKRHEKRCR